MPPALQCNGCMVRDQQITHLRTMVTALQQEVRRRLGRRSSAVLEYLEKRASANQPPQTAHEVARALKMKEQATMVALRGLRSRGLIARVGWQDVPQSRMPRALFAVSGAKK